MPKQLMNEAERYLLEHWAEARLLEESMENVRTKYKELFERITDAVTEAHPELDANGVYPTQFWGDGYFGFGRKSWPAGDTNWPSGLWIDILRLELLAEEEAEPPIAYLWFSQKAKGTLKFEPAQSAVNKAAKDLLTPAEFKMNGDGEPDDVLLYLPVPSKTEILGALVDGDGQRFVELFVAQFDMMARFVPVLDKVFRDCVCKEKE